MSKYETFNVGGLPVHVFGLDQLEHAQNEVAVLFLLHGRLGKWEDNLENIDAILSHVQSREKGLLVVTFDQRNHGHRLVSSKANTTWNEDNALHAADMHSIQMGTARDVSLLSESIIFLSTHRLTFTS